MQISTKGRYALSILIDLANNKQNEYVSLNSISLRLDKSMKYLEKITSLLVKNKLIDVSRGKNGGYKLNKDISKYKLIDILSLTEKSLLKTKCVENPSSCKNSCNCKKYKVWVELDNLVYNYLSSVTLKDIL